jgi:hypothetical protein
VYLLLADDWLAFPFNLNVAQFQRSSFFCLILQSSRTLKLMICYCSITDFAVCLRYCTSPVLYDCGFCNCIITLREGMLETRLCNFGTCNLPSFLPQYINPFEVVTGRCWMCFCISKGIRKTSLFVLGGTNIKHKFNYSCTQDHG